MIALFDSSYRIAGGGFGAPPHYERQALPASGGVAEQPAKSLHALELIERISNEELQEAIEQMRKKAAASNG